MLTYVDLCGSGSNQQKPDQQEGDHYGHRDADEPNKSGNQSPNEGKESRAESPKRRNHYFTPPTRPILTSQ